MAQSVTFSYTRNQLQELKQINTSNTLYVHNLFSTITSTYQINGLNQYASQTQNAVNLPYAYDANGNLSTETTSASTTTRTFDEDNRMTAQSLGAATLSYDAASRLSKTIINGTETQLLYDGTNLVAEYNSTGTLQKRYVHSNGTDEPIVVYNDATTTNKNWFYADHLGSIVALANTTGAATATYTYSPEGKQGGSAGIRFGYTGQQNLAGLGVQYYKARMYSADLGRFIQTDPIGMADDMNLYAYVGNNAVNRRDPSGLLFIAPAGSVIPDDTSGGNVGHIQGPQYISASVSTIVISFGATISHDGSLFFNLGTGSSNPIPSAMISVSAINNGQNLSDDAIDSFLGKFSGQLNSPTVFGFGMGQVYSSGQTATQINFGTPSLGSGSASYGFTPPTSTQSKSNGSKK